MMSERLHTLLIKIRNLFGAILPGQEVTYTYEQCQTFVETIDLVDGYTMAKDNQLATVSAERDALAAIAESLAKAGDCRVCANSDIGNLCSMCSGDCFEVDVRFAKSMLAEYDQAHGIEARMEGGR